MNTEKGASNPALPDWLEKILKRQPIFVDRRGAARLVTATLFPVAHRTLERWPLPVCHVNGKALMETRAVVTEAYLRLASAPEVPRGDWVKGQRQNWDENEGA